MLVTSLLIGLTLVLSQELEAPVLDQIIYTSLDNHENVRFMQRYYTGHIYVGSPSQKLSVIFDVGSSDIWLPVIYCKGLPSDAKVYDPEVSNSFIDFNLSETYIQYVKQNVTGYLAGEDFMIGDEGRVLTRNQTFLMADKLTGFKKLKADGIVGLGIKSNDKNHYTLVENLYLKNVIKNNIFSIFINNNKYEKDDKRKPKSMLMIGGHDLDKYSNGDDVNYYSISARNDKLWSLNMSKISVMDTDIDTDETYAVLDSNNPKIIGPKAKINKLFERFEAMYGCAYYYSRMVCDCSEIYAVVKFPHITIKIEDDEYTFHEGNYFKKTSKVCYLMFEGADIDYWVLGQPFLRKYYSIYDIKNLRIGLVEAASSKFTVDTDSNWWIIPVVLLVGGSVSLFSWLGWTYYKKYSSEKLLIEQEARG